MMFIPKFFKINISMYITFTNDTLSSLLLSYGVAYVLNYYPKLKKIFKTERSNQYNNFYA